MGPGFGDIKGPSPALVEPRNQGGSLMDIYNNLFQGTSSSTTVSPDQVVVHLKLLETLYQLRQAVEQHDGLYGVYDDDKISYHYSRKDVVDPKQLRWAVYVQMAADRFQTWWTKTVMQQYSVGSDFTWQQLEEVGSDWYKYQEPKQLTRDQLPPLDVLMIWHAYMLNPRTYLEDCMRFGLGSVWAAEMPWADLNWAIQVDSSEKGLWYRYDPGEGARKKFEMSAQIPWDPNSTENPIKDVKCYSCGTINACPWLSLRIETDGGVVVNTDSFSTSDMTYTCRGCGSLFTHDKLRLYQFVHDLGLFLTQGVPMPGTTLDVETNMPTSPKDHLMGVLLGMCRRVNEILSFYASSVGANVFGNDFMIAVKQQLEEVFKKFKKDALKYGSAKMFKKTIPMVRRILSCYWQNSSIFGQDLSACAVRQASFIENMHRFDWLHSPALSSTVQKSIVKYQRFLDLLGNGRKRRFLVPTLDIDLVWHTHQLSPLKYYLYTVKTNGMMVNHDDKVGEVTLSRGFRRSTELYEAKYKEPYSECLCWYCEAVRESVATVFQSSKTSKQLYETLGDSGHDYNSIPGPHISAHNAIKNVGRATVAEKYHQKDLWSSYQKAYKRSTKRANKLQRAPPPQCTNAAAFMFYGALAVGPAVMFMGDPSCACDDPGGYGNCVSGACSALGAAGSCCNGASCGAAPTHTPSCGGGCAGSACGGGSNCGGGSTD
uniref:ARAD1C21032p n=1 Tax=Blastobotrys adeninivorans TaxID=409370 RepID=A0A060T7E2_BLAAD